MIAYIDSSVLLQNILYGDAALERALQFPAAASELLAIECRRVLHRCRQQNQLDDESLAFALQALNSVLFSLQLIEITAAVKNRASLPFPTVIGTLDAIHLASALLLKEEKGEEVSLFSYDRQLNICAAASGLAVPLQEI